ncbi:MAG: PqiC family protein [Rhodanobacter sp.]
MIRLTTRWLAWIGALALSACASAPLHYYTLIAPATDTSDTGAEQPGTGPALPFELLPVSVPAQVDQPQLVVRDGAQGMLLLNGERWIAPLSDELRSALAGDLARALHTRDATGAADSTQPRVRIKLDVHRFDSQPGSYALIAGTWSLRIVNGAQAAALTCTSSVRESVGPGYPALVQGHQRAIAALAAQMAGAARALVAGQSATCPAS